jgi:hypothetical protein
MTESPAAAPNESAPPQRDTGLERGTPINSIARFVDWIKPYKELTAILGSAIVLLSGSVSWAVSRFATVEQLSSLECRISLNINIQALPLQASMLSMKIEGRWALIVSLSKENTADSLIRVDQLKQDLKDLSEERKRIETTFQQEVSAAPVKCAKK